jgi:hypothetical protein
MSPDPRAGVREQIRDARQVSEQPIAVEAYGGNQLASDI